MSQEEQIAMNLLQHAVRGRRSAWRQTAAPPNVPRALTLAVNACKRFSLAGIRKPVRNPIPRRHAKTRVEEGIMIMNRWVRRRIVVRALRPFYPFPIDMLRYDNCVPTTEGDAAKISRFQRYKANGYGADELTVTLTRFARIDDADEGEAPEDLGRLFENSLIRWRSKFNWEVIEDSLDDRDK